MLVIALMLAACGKSTVPRGTDTGVVLRSATTFADQPVLPNAEYLADEPFASADLKWGERIAMQCRACHTLDDGGATLLGPGLGGMFGRPAAAQENFDYSPALAAAGFVWTPAALDAWLAEPSRFLPGNRMAFAGIRDQADRDALIAYLLTATRRE